MLRCLLQAPQAKRRDSSVLTSRNVSADTGGGSGGVGDAARPNAGVQDPRFGQGFESGTRVPQNGALVCCVCVRIIQDRESALEGCPKHFGSSFNLLPQKARILEESADSCNFGVHAVDAEALMTATQEKCLDGKGCRGGSGRHSWHREERKLAFMDPILPSIRVEPYKHVLILGATLAALKRRIEFLVVLSLGNWSFESIVMMGSTRALTLSARQRGSHLVGPNSNASMRGVPATQHSPFRALVPVICCLAQVCGLRRSHQNLYNSCGMNNSLYKKSLVYRGNGKQSQAGTKHGLRILAFFYERCTLRMTFSEKDLSAALAACLSILIISLVWSFLPISVSLFKT